jgi:hypothetical protein
MRETAYEPAVPAARIDAIEPGTRSRAGAVSVTIGDQIRFSTDALESYAFTNWKPLVYDAMVVAAAIEYADRVVRRPAYGWTRKLSVRVAVHDPQHWSTAAVSGALHDAIGFLTGDEWEIEFVKRTNGRPERSQQFLNLSMPARAVIAYSQGMDSRAVAGLTRHELGDGLVLVRVGANSYGRGRREGEKDPFMGVPYSVRIGRNAKEASARSRGFKFGLIVAIAAYLAEAPEILVPESGQGAMGPALVPVAHAYPDYRNHPLFTFRMEKFVRSLFGHDVRFVFPRLWSTKGETLSAFVAIDKESTWLATRSCWRSPQWSSVGKKLRQCGTCAACLLRRMSIHAAGLTDDPDKYVCRDLSAPSPKEGIDPAFLNWSKVFDEYALAGVLHLQHLAELSAPGVSSKVTRHAALMSGAIGLSADEREQRLASLVTRHAWEWDSFINSTAEGSFIRGWSGGHDEQG